MTNSCNCSLGELPEELINSAARDLEDYSIGFVRVESTPRGDEAVLLGSGTLVSVGSQHAILTADHVLSALPRAGRLGLIMSTRFHQDTFDVKGMTYMSIARGKIDSDGPDLGAVILAPSIAGAIAAKKTFYNLDLRRVQMLNSPPELHEGVWFVNGFVAENTVAEPGRDAHELVKSFYHLAGAGGAEKLTTTGEFDYLAFLVGYSERSIAPRSFKGVSGGGLWQVPLVRDGEGQIKHESPLLSGVAFYQVPTTELDCGVKCHGRRSVYEMFCKAVEPDAGSKNSRPSSEE